MNFITKYPPSFLLTLYLITTYLPLFGEIDRIASQWISLSVINFITFIYLYFTKSITYKLFNRFTLPYFIFIIACLISLFIAINPVEGLIEITRHISIFIGLIFFFKLLNSVSNPIKRILNSVFILFILQLLAVTNQLYFDLPPIGLTANKNIVAASISLQLPFIWLYFTRYNNIISKIIALTLLLYTHYLLISIGSKAAILSSSVIVLVYFIVSYLVFKTKSRSHRIYSSIAVIAMILSYLITFNNKNNISQTFNNTINYSNDQGNLDRLRYYRETLEGFIESPLIGNGIGNWKILSIKYDAPFMKNYIVQYHAHNDFLQILAETGIVGFLLYTMFFGQIIFYSIKEFLRRKEFYIALPLLSIFVYLIDANLNFPIARVIMQVNLILVYSFLLYNLNPINEK